MTNQSSQSQSPEVKVGLCRRQALVPSSQVQALNRPLEGQTSDAAPESTMVVRTAPKGSSCGVAGPAAVYACSAFAMRLV